MNFAGITRKTEFSPNHILNDSAIMHLTAEELRRLGAKVTMYDEGQLSANLIKERFVFSMVQGPMGSSVLLEIADRGAFIINSPQSVINCYRVNMVSLLAKGGIPFPKSTVVTIAAPPNRVSGELKAEKMWVKRGDVHAVHKEDVTLAYDRAEVISILDEYQQRGIRQAVLQEHVDGDTVKFYSIRESDFFHWYYLNGVYRTPFPVDRLRDLAIASAEVLGLYVYGGDAIVGRDGTITIIDINDWPSFARVRDEASRHIAQLIHRKASEYVHERD